MYRHFIIRIVCCMAALLVVITPPASAQEPAPKAEEKKKQPQVRLICVSAVVENQDVVLATRTEDGKWKELGGAQIRSSFITEWIPAQAGELHVAVKEQETLRSLGKFTYPSECRSAIAVLLPAADKASYSSFVVEPEKIAFTKGSVLAVNFSKQTGYLLLGTTRTTVASGQRVVAKPTLEENGMYRFMVAYQDEQKQPVTCYDRYLPGSPDSRELLFLFPDATQGLKVMSIPMFGDLE